ncbi:O-antigen ligase family protein [Phenylobacterium sp.]|uniref:O-antigen ligase family protein n=1 Tax=Phenylobacterium sp. TaxID=1871053 RepID=UPI0025E13E00|nr:O-antigen ligase family protein [Phenylobacterium sp.]
MGPTDALTPFYRRRTETPRLKLLAYVALFAASVAYGAAFAYGAPHYVVVFALPVAIIIVLGIWALPSGDYAPVGVIPWLFFGYFAALILWPIYLAIALPGLPWITPLRLTGVPLLLVMLICASVSSDFRRQVGEVLKADPWIIRCLLGFVLLEGLSLMFSRTPGTSVNRFITSQINWTGIFFAACYIFRKPGAASAWAKLLLSAGLLLCVLGVWESRAGAVLWANHIPSFLRIEDESVLKALAGVQRAYGGFHRVQATAGTPLGFAEYLGLTMPFAMHFALNSRSIAFRIISGTYVPLAIYVIILTDSRLGIVASLVSAMLYLLLWSIRRWRMASSSILGPALVLAYPAIFLTGIAATFLVGRLRKSVWGGGAQQASTDSRKDQWAMAIPKILHQPMGHGQGRGGQTLGYVAADGSLTIDSYYLTLLLEFGVLGFALYMALFLRTSWTGGVNAFSAKTDNDLLLLMPLSVALFDFVVVKAVLSQDHNHPLVFMMLGATLALVYRSKIANAETEKLAIRRAVTS